MDNNKINDIFTKRADGLCDSCGYGFDNCIRDGKPKCEEEVEDGEQESV